MLHVAGLSRFIGRAYTCHPTSSCRISGSAVLKATRETQHSTLLRLPCWATQKTDMGEVVDLTFSDSEEDTVTRSPVAAQQAAPARVHEEQQQRKRIMEFAKHKAAASDPKRVKSSRLDADLFAKSAEASSPAHADGAAGVAAAAAAASSDGLNAAAAVTAAAGQGAGFSNADLRALHEARMRRQKQQQQQPASPGNAGGSDAAQEDASHKQAAGSSTAAAAAAGGSPSKSTPGATAAAASSRTAPGSSSRSISLLTYNVWFKEEVAVLERMIGLGDIVRQAGLPTFICLQEVTPLILEILSNMDWWREYECSPHPCDVTYFTLLLVKKSTVPGVSQSAFDDQPFRNSVMARGLRSVKTSVGGHPILVVTSHLESPVPPQSFYSKQRQQQMSEALKALDASATGNVLFAGDMNWEDKRDGPPPLPASWQDAWATLQPGQPGFTYDAKNNPMLPYKGLALRLDRVLCKLRDWRLDAVQLVGTQPLAGIAYTHRFRNGGSKELPVLPSDHFGLLVKLTEA